jgi:hypothetical protein
LAYNLFIAYDLIEPGQNYDAVKDRIRELGPHWQFQYSLFYVHSRLNPAEAAHHVLQSMDVEDYPGRNQGKDRLLVIDAKEGMTTTWDHPPIAEINAIWHQP